MSKREERKGNQIMEKRQPMPICPVYKKCGGCDYQGIPYEEQLKRKEARVKALLAPYCKVKAMIGMEHPYYYRNKVHAVFDRDRKGNPISGVYQKGTHRVVPVESCMIEDQKADEIIGSIRGLLKSFKIKVYDEDTGYGLLRHVLVRRGFSSGQIMVVLVCASPVFPSKNHFVKALLKLHPEITTIVLNVNDKRTSMVLGDREKPLYGRGYIEDTLCGCVFRISPQSFYQINPVQTEILYKKAIELAGLTGKETILDAYCGIGTIGLCAAGRAKQVIGVERNPDAVRNACANAAANKINNARFICADATDWMRAAAQPNSGLPHPDVVFLDPPREGSTPACIDAVAAMKPKRVVYVSCNPETLARDLTHLTRRGWKALKIQPVDMFPHTEHVETVVLLSKLNVK